VLFFRSLDYVAKNAEKIAEILKANGWKYNEKGKFWSNHEVTVGFEMEPKLTTNILTEVPEKEWKFFSPGSYRLHRWRNSYLSYKKQVVPAVHLINLIRILYERFSSNKMAKVVVAVCGGEKPAFAFLPYKGDHAKFLIAPYSTKRINREDMVYDLARDRFIKWKDYSNPTYTSTSPSHTRNSLLDFVPSE